ncbi:hypothetical protein J1N35_005548 [Gossypium stocksii]|uniref:Aminotransferase-like plant mobile domain-containing protein n=1 Tax=Gossypium stocksii TaxID=47602 RepID=A0A9D4AJ31_9ROSI|nr:hypothetical protein J1N35_005548 [Gossypium stocksii]
MLYKEMYGATQPNKAKIGGCLSLLQSWARLRFPFLHPRVDHPYAFPLITRWNHSASYVRIPTSLEDIWLLLDQRLEAQVPLVNYATMEMHQSDRVLRQSRFRQLIPMAPEVFDEEHKVDLRQLYTEWSRYWSHYIEMWENRPISNAYTITRPNNSIDDTHITTFLDYARPIASWNPWPSSSPFPITPNQPLIYRPPSYEGSHEALSGSSSFYQSQSPYEIQTPLLWVTLPTPTTGSRGTTTPTEAKPRWNLARTRRRPLCGTDSDRHGH